MHQDVDPFRVLFVGRITQAKGISYLIKAFGKLGISRSELVLLGRIVGSNAPWRDERRVRHVPHVPRWMLPDHYRAAHVFVLPSLIEGFPLTALEAMACGIPPIVSEHTFAHDVITDGVNGYVVPIRDSDAIAERLEHLQRYPDARRAMGAAARRTAEELSWVAFGSRVATLLTESNP
jgi:glycosyltransferase involved in cell wall biosynthesis